MLRNGASEGFGMWGIFRYWQMLGHCKHRGSINKPNGGRIVKRASLLEFVASVVVKIIASPLKIEKDGVFLCILQLGECAPVNSYKGASCPLSSYTIRALRIMACTISQ
jgi:hypothetical protein